MVFNLFSKRDSFSSDNIEDRICRTLEYKLNILRHQFLTGGIPIVKKDLFLNYLEQTIEIHMSNLKTVHIHLQVRDISRRKPYIVSDIWTKVDTSTCKEIGVHGICVAVKKLIRRKICRQLATTVGYLFQRDYLGYDDDFTTDNDIQVNPNKKIDINDVKVYACLNPEDRVDWLLVNNYTVEEMREINSAYKKLNILKNR